MSQRVICVDVDGVVADVHRVVLGQYNQDYDDVLSLEQITSWYMHEYVKPDCGKRIYDYMKNPSIYDLVPPIKGARAAIEVLRSRGNRIIFVTSCFAGTADAKERWLVRHGFLHKVNINHDFVVLADKHLLRADALVDDKPDNLQHFQGKRLLFSQPWNAISSCQGMCRVHNWVDVIYILTKN